MKYGFEGLPLEDTVEKYVKLDDSIEVYMLNGDKIVFDLTEEDEKKIIDTMLEQARMRNTDLLWWLSIMKLKKVALINVISYSFCFAVDVLLAMIVKNNGLKFLFSVLSGIEGVRVIHNSREYKHRKDEITELQKYNIYLYLMDLIEKYRNCDWLYTGVKCQGDLNINTIDNFSLKDIERIEFNIFEHKSLFEMEDDEQKQYYDVEDEFLSLLMQKTEEIKKERHKKLSRKINKK